MNALRASLTAVDIELSCLQSLRESCAADLAPALDLLLSCRGRVVVSGLGKSGHIGSKMAATFASTGTPSFFVHATEALHGDSGMVELEDVVVLISHSGRTTEVVQFGTMVTSRGVPVLAMSANPASPLGRLARVHVSIAVEREADPLGLAPTSSTTCTLVLGDALAAGLMAAKEFTAEEFHRFHPGGALGVLLEEGADK